MKNLEMPLYGWIAIGAVVIGGLVVIISTLLKMQKMLDAQNK